MTMYFFNWFPNNAALTMGYGFVYMSLNFELVNLSSIF